MSIPVIRVLGKHRPPPPAARRPPHFPVVVQNQKSQSKQTYRPGRQAREKTLVCSARDKTLRDQKSPAGRLCSSARPNPPALMRDVAPSDATQGGPTEGIPLYLVAADELWLQRMIGSSQTYGEHLDTRLFSCSAQYGVFVFVRCVLGRRPLNISACRPAVPAVCSRWISPQWVQRRSG